MRKGDRLITEYEDLKDTKADFVSCAAWAVTGMFAGIVLMTFIFG